MNDKKRPALIGGVILGLLSAIPFVNFVNACCCAWAIIGGIVAAYLYIKSSPTPVKTGDGAMIGALAGLVGAVIYIILGVPMSLLVGNTLASMAANLMANADPAQAEVFRQQIAQSQTVVSAIVSAIITATLLVIFSTVGGLLAVPIFEKRKDGGMGVPPPPSPPPGYGGQPTGGYAPPPPPDFGGPQGSGGSQSS